MASVALQQARLTSMPFEQATLQMQAGPQEQPKSTDDPKTKVSDKVKDVLVTCFSVFSFILCCCGICTPRRRFRPGAKKPVIYLFSPKDIDASVTLSIVPEWKFSIIYPIVPVKRLKNSWEQIQWRVRTRTDGTLTDLQQGLDIAYLFWEAEVNNERPISPPQSPVLGGTPPIKIFSPTTCDLDESNSVLLPVENVSSYLEAALKQLGLHIQARTDFITFWLPSFLKHKYIALRFLPQSEYTSAAPLDISPQPDVVTRVFMLFKGMNKSEWPAASTHASEDTGLWKDVVQVDLDRARDTHLFRVLEWGAMEVMN